MREELEILKKVCKLWPNNLDGGLPIIQKYGFEKVKSATVYAFKAGYLLTPIVLWSDGKLKGRMRECGFDPIPCFPLSLSGVDVLTPIWKKKLNIAIDECSKKGGPIIVSGIITFILILLKIYIVIPFLLPILLWR